MTAINNICSTMGFTFLGADGSRVPRAVFFVMGGKRRGDKQRSPKVKLRLASTTGAHLTK